MVFFMDELPDHLIWEIISRVLKTRDKNSVSLTCKRLCKIESEERKTLRIGCGLNPANEAVGLLCTRFTNLRKVEISYRGWNVTCGYQLDDHGLLVVSNCCHNLNKISLIYCTSITNAGLTHLGSFSNLSALKLSSIPGVMASGLSSVVARCKHLRLLHLTRCLNIRGLSYLVNHEKLEHLCIKNCLAINEVDIIRLGTLWLRLKRLHFEVPRRRNRQYTQALTNINWQEELITCDSLEELILRNCYINPGRGGMACLLEKCKKLKRLNLKMCCGLSDENLSLLSLESGNLQSLCIRVPPDVDGLFVTWNLYHPRKVTNTSLMAIAANCSRLERFHISSDVYYSEYSPFNLNGLLPLVRSCPLRRLALDLTDFVDDIAMKTICSSSVYLEELELRYLKITDIGIQFLRHLPRLCSLTLQCCTKITDNGFNTFLGSNMLDVLYVLNCRLVSARRVLEGGIAKTAYYKLDSKAWVST